MNAYLLIPVLASVACVRLHGPRDLRRELSDSTGVRLEREVGFTVTRSGVWLARMGLDLADESPVSLKGVKRVQVGIYKVDGLARGSDERSPLRAGRLLEGWEPVVRVNEEDEEVLQRMVRRHFEYTRSRRADEVLRKWNTYAPRFVKVFPRDLKMALDARLAAGTGDG